MTTKMCYDCQHCYVEQKSFGYSERSPGSDFDMWCLAKHWRVDLWNVDRWELKRYLRTAETCQDYTPDPEVVSIGQKGG